MGDLNPIVLPVDGALDTANPATNRKPGTLTEAVNVSTLWWGPRTGWTQQTWPYQNYVYSKSSQVLNGTTSTGTMLMRSKHQYNLGTRWTLDLVITPEAVSHSADADLSIFLWDLSTSATLPMLTLPAINVFIKGGGAAAADQRKIKVVTKSTSGAGSVGTTTTLTGTTQLGVGTTIDKLHHIRVARNVENLYLYVDGTLEASSTAAGTQRHESVVGNLVYGTCMFGYGVSGGNHLYKGMIHRATLREWYSSDMTRGMQDYQFPWSQGTKLDWIASVDGVAEYSPFGGQFTWANTSTSSITEPLPWFQTPVQAGTQFTDRRGRSWNYVMAGGTLYWKRVG